jgi:hypothetical protein
MVAGDVDGKVQWDGPCGEYEVLLCSSVHVFGSFEHNATFSEAISQARRVHRHIVRTQVVRVCILLVTPQIDRVHCIIK